MIKADLISQKGEQYKITNLGRIAASLYYEPFSVASFYRNMNTVTDKGKNIMPTDADYAYIIANSHQYLKMFIPTVSFTVWKEHNPPRPPERFITPR